MNTFVEYVKHYLLALAATTLNGGIIAVVAVASNHQVLSVMAVWGTFKWAAFLAGLGYLYQHPIPVPDLPVPVPAGQPPAPAGPPKAYNPFSK